MGEGREDEIERASGEKNEIERALRRRKNCLVKISIDVELKL